MLTFDIRHIPLARRGSWLSCSRPSYPHTGIPPEGDGIYLRSNRGRPFFRRELVKIEVLRDGQVLSVLEETARPDGLQLRDGQGGQVTLCFAGTATVIIEGSGGLGLRLSRQPLAGEVAHILSPGIMTINCRQSLCRLAVEAMRGQATLDAPWAQNQCQDIRIEVQPDARGRCLLAIDEWQSAWVRGPRPPVAAARSELRASFADFQGALPALAAEHRSAAALANYILWSCAVPPRGILQRECVLMSRNWMDSLWSWDNCFNAMALAEGHPQLAFAQLMIEADLQDQWGAYPDAATDTYAHYNYSKPPVQGIAYYWIQEANPRFWTKARLRQWYPSVAAFTTWWLRHRRWPGAQCCHYLHGNDSGWDNSTMFDQGAPLQSPDLNAFLSVQAGALAHMAQRLGDGAASRRWQRVASRLRRHLIRELWDGERFVARLAENGRAVTCDSLIPCMPLVLGEDLPLAIRRRLIDVVERFVTPWGVATEDPASPCFEHDGYWRGPVWAPSSLLIVHGLRRSGREDLAQKVAHGFCRACTSSGFAENFNALNGTGLRDRAYTWTAAVFRSLGRG